MTNFEQNNFFSIETLSYLENSFLKINRFEHKDLFKIFSWLSTVPKYTTIRINKCKVEDEANLDELQSFIDNAYQTGLNQTNGPKLERANDLVNECVLFKSLVSNEAIPVNELKKKVIIDRKCAQAVLRGADIFIPGIISLSKFSKANDEISVYADISSKCTKGADAKKFVSQNPELVRFIGNGILLVNRDDLFKSSEPIKSGLGVKIKSLKDNVFFPSFEALDNSKYYLQNLPSIICAKVLDPKENELILDMCAAPGGKTTHIAALVNNKSKIIAFDKIPAKIAKLKKTCELMNAHCIESFCQDATEIDFNVWKPNSFDRILVDAPCSSLGVRPLVYNVISPAQLASYIKYQKSILDNAVELLKPGGYLVYSTCTITLEENEEQISWLVNKYKNMKIVDQYPYHFSRRKSLNFSQINLDEKELNMLQRFMPNHILNDNLENEEAIDSSCLNDTNGFFIAKLLKTNPII